MSKSIIQDKKECYLCRLLYGSSRIHGLENHHCIPGTANRRQSDKCGLTVWLCAEHHRCGKLAVHRNPTTMALIKVTAQEAFERNHSREEFVKIFGRSYV